MSADTSPDTAATFREQFLRDPEFRDQLAANSQEALSALLGPLNDTRTSPAASWSTQTSYPSKKDQEVKYW